MAAEYNSLAMLKNCAVSAAATQNMQEGENPFSKFPSFPSQNLENSFSFPDFSENGKYQGLEEIYKDIVFYEKPQGINTSNENPQNYFNTQPPLQVFNYSLADDTPFTFPTIDYENQGTKKRKIEPIEKMVHQMTKEELLADLWAWRKYGQKPIKGTPHPRHYYRCSTSKGCSARKHVELSPDDSSIFLVTYSGYHTHPRPTHRTTTCYAGGRPKNPLPKYPSPAPALPPATHSTVKEVVVLDDDDDDDDDIMLIPNTFMTEEIFRGFEEINGGVNRGNGSVNIGSGSGSKIGEFSGGKFSDGSTTTTGGVF